MSVGKAFEAASHTAIIGGEIQAALATEALPACEIADRIERPTALVIAVLRMMRHGGLVEDGPGPDGGVIVWRRTR